MAVSVTVWAVELGELSDLSEVKGSLAILEEDLVFSPAPHSASERDGTGGAAVAERRIPLAQISRAHRLRGSPVLMVERRDKATLRRTAFYFVPPPRLRASGPSPEPRTRGFGDPRRRERRRNITYLGWMNREKKVLLREWEGKIRAAVAARRP